MTVIQMANALGERLAAALPSSTPVTAFPLVDRTKRKQLCTQVSADDLTAMDVFDDSRELNCDPRYRW